jgi:hypothetical protein
VSYYGNGLQLRYRSGAFPDRIPLLYRGYTQRQQSSVRLGSTWLIMFSAGNAYTRTRTDINYIRSALRWSICVAPSTPVVYSFIENIKYITMRLALIDLRCTHYCCCIFFHREYTKRSCLDRYEVSRSLLLLYILSSRIYEASCVDRYEVSRSLLLLYILSSRIYEAKLPWSIRGKSFSTAVVYSFIENIRRELRWSIRVKSFSTAVVYSFAENIRSDLRRSIRVKSFSTSVVYSFAENIKYITTRTCVDRSVSRPLLLLYILSSRI